MPDPQIRNRRNKAGELVAIVRLAVDTPELEKLRKRYRKLERGTYSAHLLPRGPGADRAARGDTPRQALASLAARVGEPVAPGRDYITKIFMAQCFDEPAPVGRPPVRAERATEPYTLRMPASLKRRLLERAMAEDTSPAQVLLDALEAHLDAKTRARSTQ